MNKKCPGCGITLQSENLGKPGYIPEERISKSNYCERCYKIMHYNEKVVTELKNINSYIIDNVNEKAKYVYFMIDLLNINSETISTFKKITVPKTLIISKLDVIPRSIKENIITNWIKGTYQIKEDIIYQSTKKNINTKSIVRNLEERKINECYILGYTNAGKSTLINKLSELSENKNNEITTSLNPNTTVDFIKINLNDNLTIIDSPGFTPEKTIYSENDFELIKRINPKTFLKPTTYQVKDISSIIIEDKIRITSSIKNSLTLYMSNEISIERVFENNKKLLDKQKVIIDIPDNSDLVIKSLGFINVKNACKITINSDDTDLFEVRKSMFRDK